MNSTAATSAADEHDNAYDSTDSRKPPRIKWKTDFPVSRTWFDREPDLGEGGTPARSGERTAKQDLFPENLGGAAEKTENSSEANLDNDGVKVSEGIESLHVDGSRAAGPSGNRLRRIRPRELEVDEDSRYVSSSGEQKVIAVRVRVGHRTERVQVRDLVRVLETKSETGRTPEIRAVREFFDWSGLLRNNSVKTLEEDRPAEFISPCSQREKGLERQGNVGTYLLLSDFLTAQGKANDSMSPISQKRRMSIAKPLETAAPNGGLDCLDCGCVQSRRYVSVLIQVHASESSQFPRISTPTRFSL